jgi:hypothetical protein
VHMREGREHDLRLPVNVVNKVNKYSQ